MDASESNSSCPNWERLWEVLGALQAQLNALRERLAEQEERNRKLEAENKKLQQQNQKLQQQIDRLKKKLEESEKHGKRQTTRFPRRQRAVNPKKPGRKKGSQPTHGATPRHGRRASPGPTDAACETAFRPWGLLLPCTAFCLGSTLWDGKDMCRPRWAPPARPSPWTHPLDRCRPCPTDQATAVPHPQTWYLSSESPRDRGRSPHPPVPTASPPDEPTP